MRKDVHSWYSDRIGTRMPVVTYGHWGYPLLMFPTATADAWEYERFGLIDTIGRYIDEGRVKVYSVNCMNRETLLNDSLSPGRRAYLHEFYDQYITQEVVPFIHSQQGGRQGIITCGASLGAYHSMNFLLRHPDVFSGTIAMSGAYDLEEWTGGSDGYHFYINSPLRYVPQLPEGPQLWALREHGKRIHLLTGQGDYESPDQSRRLSRMLWDKGVWHNLDVWGHDMKHDWPTWMRMLPHYVGTREF